MKKMLFVLIPILAIGGVIGMAFMGLINIPGITPAKKKALAAGLYAEKKEPPVAKKEAPKKREPIVRTEVTKPDLEAGLKKLASLWNTIEASALVEITSKWKDKDLAPVLFRMGKDQVSAFLIAIKPDRASALSIAIQKEAEKPKS